MPRHIKTLTLLFAFFALSHVAIAQSKTAPATPEPASTDTPATAPAEKPKEEAPRGLIKWQTSYADTLAQAEQTKKPIMVEQNANQGWGEVKIIQIDSDPVIAKLVNEHFLPVKDADDLAPILKKYHCEGWVTTLLFSHDGKFLLTRIDGYRRPAAFMNELADALYLQKTYLKKPEAVTAYIAAVPPGDPSGNPSETVEKLNLVIKTYPDMGLAYFARARRLMELGKTHQAISDFAKARELLPGTPSTMQSLGTSLIASGKYLQAAKELDNARKATIRGDHELAMYQIVALVRAGKAKEAQALLEEIAARPDDKAYTYLEFAIRAILQNKIQDIAKSSQGDESSRSLVYWAVGNILASKGDKPGAIIFFQKALRGKQPYLTSHILATQDLRALGVQSTAVTAPKPPDKR